MKTRLITTESGEKKFVQTDKPVFSGLQHPTDLTIQELGVPDDELGKKTVRESS